MKKKMVLVLIAFMALYGVVISCSQEEGNSISRIHQENTVMSHTGLQIKLPDAVGRGIIYYQQSEVNHYSISVTLNGDTVAALQGQPGDTVTVDVTVAGIYSIYVAAYNDENVIIADGYASAYVSLVEDVVSVNISVTANVKSAGSTLNINIGWVTPSVYVYKIIYHNLEDGTTTSPADYDTRDWVSLSNATRDGYIFCGWYDNDNFTGNKISYWNAGERAGDVDLWAKWASLEDFNIQGTGVYSFSQSVDSVSTAWGGSPANPSFSVVLLNDAAIEVVESALIDSFQQMPIGSPVYQICGDGNTTIMTAKDGTWSTKYDGIVATVADGNYTLYVDMSRINITQLKGLGEDFNGCECMMAESGIADIDLLSYQPYVIALYDNTADISYIGNVWNGAIHKMNSGAVYPNNAQNPPIVVSFDTGVADAIEPVELESGDTLSQPNEWTIDEIYTFNDNKYRFGGWYQYKWYDSILDEYEFYSEYSFGNTLTESFVLYAKWTLVE